MTHRGTGLLLLALALWPAFGEADLTLSGYSAAGAFGMPLSSQEHIYIHDTLIRRDYVDRGRYFSHLFDLAKHRVAVIDHAARQIEMHDLNNLQATAEVSAPAAGMKLAMERTGQTRPLRTWNCEAYRLTASIPARLGNEETVFHLNGLVWVASNVAEQAEVKGLVKLARQPDFFLGIPAVAKVTPAQSQLFSEIIRSLAPKGLPCACELEASYEGNGPMANLARKMPTRLNIAFQDFTGAALKPELFNLPAGYSVRP
ncbi:hypothetical protein EZJ19_07475 [Parasulfuritortus cantonensis]|uniref:DUF4412 domain-containing protein n=1 Tax=Parasulfuritortus cantonensis TaxID=2528202 RepID=A0A4R1BDV1_9PROT|nr:hypothetical protein [Parasulfuritortus cantonensis]TCJ15270.1 hypothetical protein EZJ19_07475 [Parasulfuritortus cantonensis]